MFNQQTETITNDSRFPDPDVISYFKIYADEHRLLLQYSSDEKIAIVYFSSILIFKFGIPNDEAIHGHPLFSKGLEPYQAQIVTNSSWVDQLEKQNRVHPGHDKKMFEGYEHLVFTGQDNIFECVVANSVDPEIHIADETQAQNLWQKIIRNRFE
ncbi:MAG: hypothetical protein GY761_11335 [Hyphomicrobiales bacterium]|nr:hypothetical protein [Hyphomicrobiales bacterium]